MTCLRLACDTHERGVPQHEALAAIDARAEAYVEYVGTSEARLLALECAASRGEKSTERVLVAAASFASFIGEKS